jgi:hypothetical protein
MTTAFSIAILVVSVAVPAVLAYRMHPIDVADADDEDDDRGGGGGGGVRLPRPPDPPAGDGAPAWWPAFEAQFAEHVAARRERSSSPAEHGRG